MKISVFKVDYNLLVPLYLYLLIEYYQKKIFFHAADYGILKVTAPLQPFGLKVFLQ